MADWNENNGNNNNENGGNGDGRWTGDQWSADEQACRDGDLERCKDANRPREMDPSSETREMGEMGNTSEMNEMGEAEKMRKMRETGDSENSGDREIYGVYESYESFEAYDGDKTPYIIESEKEFEEIISEGVAMIDFYAKWCGPCQMTGRTFDSLAQRFAGRAKIAKVDVDAHPKLGTKCDISAVPTVLLYEDGKLRERFVGVRSEAELADALEVALAGVGV